MQTFLLFSFLVYKAIAHQPPQESTLSTFPSSSIEDPPAGLFDEDLTTPDWGIKNSWGNYDDGFLTALNDSPIDHSESTVLADKRVDCIHSNNLSTPSRLREREQKKLFCAPQLDNQESTISSPDLSNTKKGGIFLPTPGDERPRPWPDLKGKSEMTKLWVQLNTLPGINGWKNREVCMSAMESVPGVARHVPICFPHPYALDSPSDVVQPCRLCKWFPETT